MEVGRILALGLALVGSLAAAPLPARLDPLKVPLRPTLELRRVGEFLQQGRIAEAQEVCSYWRYRNPAEAARPLLALVRTIYRLSYAAREVEHGVLTLVLPPTLEMPPDLAGLEAFYRKQSRELLGEEDPLPLRVHLVKELDPLVHGVHFVGHLAAESDGWPEIVRHELMHSLLNRHPARRNMRGVDYWLEEGLAEAVGRTEDLRLRARLPLREELPGSLSELFPPSGLWRGRHRNPVIDYLGAYAAVRMLIGGSSPFSLGASGLVRGLHRGNLDALLRERRGQTRKEFEASWLRRMRREYSLGEEGDHQGPEIWQARARYLSPARRGRPLAAARAMEKVAREAGEPLPSWLLTDSISLGSALARDPRPEARAALKHLTGVVPFVGLTVPAGLRDADWTARVLERVLKSDPPPRLLLYMTLVLWNSPHQAAVEKAWAAGIARHGEETRWLQGEGIRIAYMGRLAPPEGSFAAVHARLQRLMKRLEGRKDLDQELLHPLEEARAAYAFGAGDFASCAEILETQQRREGLDPRRLLNLGAALLRQGKKKEARAAYERGLMIDPAFPGLRLGLGVTLKQLGNLAGARRVLEEAPDTGPDAPRILANRAEIHRLLGNEAEAEALRERADEAGYDPEGSPVPAEFKVMIHTGLERMLEVLREIRLAPLAED